MFYEAENELRGEKASFKQQEKNIGLKLCIRVLYICGRLQCLCQA